MATRVVRPRSWSCRERRGGGRATDRGARARCRGGARRGSRTRRGDPRGRHEGGRPRRRARRDRRGRVDLGENRAQDLATKADALNREEVARVHAHRWHFIGRLQRNKVRAAAPYVALWQSIDRAELAAEVGHRAPGTTVLRTSQRDG